MDVMPPTSPSWASGEPEVSDFDEFLNRARAGTRRRAHRSFHDEIDRRVHREASFALGAPDANWCAFPPTLAWRAVASVPWAKLTKEVGFLSGRSEG
jgi:hypothetical protein